jgi:hypothetical protein
VLDAVDGFNVPHKCAEFDTDTTATFILYVNASDAEPLQIGGSLEAKRKEYFELNTRRPIDALTEAAVAIDRLPKYNVPLNFEGWIDAYADPRPSSAATTALSSSTRTTGTTASRWARATTGRPRPPIRSPT